MFCRKAAPLYLLNGQLFLPIAIMLCKSLQSRNTPHFCSEHGLISFVNDIRFGVLSSGASSDAVASNRPFVLRRVHKYDSILYFLYSATVSAGRVRWCSRYVALRPITHGPSGVYIINFHLS